MTYHMTTPEEVEILWEYDVDPGYSGSRIDPPEPPGVDNLRAFFVGPCGELSPVPDWMVECLRDDDSLLIGAQETEAERRYEAADHRLMMRQEAAV